MKTLVINGSLKGEASHSMMVARKFVEGIMEATGTEVRILELGPMNINHCRGCFACWKVMPGTCAIRDDMDIIKEAILESDIIVFSFPLYFFGMSSKMTTMLNRLLPLKMPYKGRLATEDNPIIMDFRYDLGNKKLVLVSSCAHASTDMVYDAVTTQFDMILGKDNYTTVFTPQGEILMLDKMKPILNAYLNKVKDAGVEFGQNGSLSDETHKKVCAPLIPVRAVEKMMTGYWEDYPQ
ncbi:MAG: flavodoxin family protein [Butyrivibrio sp.]